MQTAALNSRALRVEFNPLNRRETEDAKTKYRQAKEEHRKILNLDRQPISNFREADQGGGFIIDEVEMSETDLAMHFIDMTGDRRLIWNMRDPDQVKEAATKFKEYVAKGWKPYAYDRKGRRGQRIYSFDVEAQEVIFDDKTTKEKLADFVKKFKEVKFMPKTTPG